MLPLPNLLCQFGFIRDAAAGGQEVRGEPAPDAEGQDEDFCETVDPVTEQEEQVGEAAGAGGAAGLDRSRGLGGGATQGPAGGGEISY
jgi:hypothetical protein